MSTTVGIPRLAPGAGTRELGRWGEELAARLLTSRGYAILSRNWRSTCGELDIVALSPDRSAVVAVEVKTRRRGGNVAAIDAISPTKLARLRKLLAMWVDERGARCPRLRIDLVAITVDRRGSWGFRHVEAIS